MDIIDRDVIVANGVKIIGVKIDGVHIDIVINEYRNCICVNVAQFGKLGSFILVSKEGAKPVNGSDVYTVRTLLGRDNVAYQTAARFLHEQTCMTKPAIFSIDLKDLSVRMLKALKQIIVQHKMW